MSFSEPAVAHLIGGAFIPVVFSMNLQGPGCDADGREFVQRHAIAGRSDLYPPDLFVVDPQGDLLGRLAFDASPGETVDFLKGILAENPALAPAAGPGAFDLPPPSTPGEVALEELRQRYDTGDRGGLVGALEKWLEDYAAELPTSAAMARVMLGGARYHADDFAGADAAWESVLVHHPDNPLRHRAAYNRIEKGSFPSVPHPDVADHELPPMPRRGIVVPAPESRTRHLAEVEADPRYLHSLSPDLPFVRIPAATFTMGGTPAVQERELPTRQVTITRPFLMSAWPITRGLWKQFRPEDIPADETDPLASQLPMVGISWTGAQALCEFLTQRDGRPFRLPSEAEWELAARGGLEAKMYPWGDETATPELCNYLNRRPVPVACYPPNRFGLFDMVGNNFEWTNDYYLADAFARTPSEITDPAGPTLADTEQFSPDGACTRVVRGGGWMSNEMSRISCRNSWRLGWPEFFQHGNIGVRLVSDAD